MSWLASSSLLLHFNFQLVGVLERAASLGRLSLRHLVPRVEQELNID
jgi:hypothetical protein